MNRKCDTILKWINLVLLLGPISSYHFLHNFNYLTRILQKVKYSGMYNGTTWYRFSHLSKHVNSRVIYKLNTMNMLRWSALLEDINDLVQVGFSTLYLTIFRNKTFFLRNLQIGQNKQDCLSLAVLPSLVSFLEPTQRSSSRVGC